MYVNMKTLTLYAINCSPNSKTVNELVLDLTITKRVSLLVFSNMAIILTNREKLTGMSQNANKNGTT